MRRRGMRVIYVLILSLATFWVGTSNAKPTCDAGDSQIGPNCVNVVMLPSPRQPMAFSKVYRLTTKGKKKVVWQGQGFVTESTTTKLVVLERSVDEERGHGEYEFKYTWDGTAYTNRIQCPDGPECE